ncbi:hypothetical protein FOXYSP1_17389 [Fusarium oxysporum f. sp. phaseoli]
MNSKSQAASCCLDDRQTEHEYKRPTLVAPLDRKSSAHLVLAVHPHMRYARVLAGRRLVEPLRIAAYALR